MKNRVNKQKVFKLAQEREEPVFKNEDAKAGDHVVLTLRIQGDHDRYVYVKVWDGKQVYIWKGAEWHVVQAIKTSAYEDSNTSPLWWSMFSWRS